MCPCATASRRPSVTAAGADEISRICRTLSSSGRVAAAAGGGVQVRAPARLLLHIQSASPAWLPPCPDLPCLPDSKKSGVEVSRAGGQASLGVGTTDRISSSPLPYGQVLPLHGGLPPSQQSRVFNRPPKGAPLLQMGGTCGSSSARLPSAMRLP